MPTATVLIQPTEVTAASAVTVTLATPGSDTTNTATQGEPADLNANAHVLQVSFPTPTNASTTHPLLFTSSKNISVVTLHDNDAEDENFTLAFTLDADGSLDQGADNDDAIVLATSTAADPSPYNPNALKIDDDETQSYTLTLQAGQTPPKEGEAFMVDLKAAPAHVNGSGSMNVIIDKQTGWVLTIGDADSANPAVVTNTGADTTVEISITQTAGDRNRVTDTVTVSAHTGVTGASRAASLAVDRCCGRQRAAEGHGEGGRRQRGGRRAAAHVGGGRRVRQDRGHAARQGRQGHGGNRGLSRSRWIPPAPPMSGTIG